MYTSATVFDRPQHVYFVHDAIVFFDTNKVGYPRFWLFHGFPCYSHVVRIAGLNWDRMSRERRFHPYRDVTSRETHTSSTTSTMGTFTSSDIPPNFIYFSLVNCPSMTAASIYHVLVISTGIISSAFLHASLQERCAWSPRRG